MTIAKSALRALLILSPICSAISAKADYSPNFSSGQLPAGVTTVNKSAAKPLADFYRRGWTEDGWIVDRIGGKGFVVMAPSHTGSETAVRSILTLPAQEIEATTWLSWEALSLLSDFPEAYRVLVQPADGNAEEVFSTGSENDEWTLRMVSLERFAGKKCNVIFECNSVNRYMLMLSGIKIFNPAEESFSLSDTTPAFGDMNGTTVTGTLLNTGLPLSGASLVCLLADGSEAGRLDLGYFATGGRTEFSFTCPAESDTRTAYSLAVEKLDSSRTLIGEGSYYSSSFVRTLLVDKATGMWCTNCPAGNILIDGLLRDYAGQIAVVETHISGNDPLENTAYWDNLGFHSIPSFKLNRIEATAGNDIAAFAGYYDMPVRFGLTFSSIEAVGNDAVKVGVRVAAAENFDNSSDRYRIGYVMTATFHNDRYHQTNGCNAPNYMRYYYLPKDIPGELVSFHNVAITSECAFTGIAGSLPAAITVGSETECVFSVNRPESLADLRDGTLVAYLLDTETGDVLNAATTPLAADFGGVETAVADPAVKTLAATADGALLINVAGRWSLRCFDMTGRICLNVSGSGAESLPMQLPAGIYVARLDSGSGAARIKFAVKQ